MRTLLSYLLASVAMFLLFGGILAGFGDGVVAGSVLAGSMIVADAIAHRDTPAS